MKNVWMQGKRGFTLIELLVVIAIIALLIGILLPALGEARKTAKLSTCSSQMKQLNTASASYASEYQDRIAAFTFGSRDGRTGYSDLDGALNGNISDLDAAAIQAVGILRRRAGREDIQRITGWIPHVLYTHLVLQDYMASRLPEKLVVCPEDKTRLEWQRDPVNYATRFYPVPRSASGNAGKRWPYSSSYQFVPASYDRFQSVLNSPTAANRRITQAGHSSYRVPGSVDLGNLRLSDVDFTADKVYFHDSHGRHFGRVQLYYGYDDSRQPLAFFDGSVRVNFSNEMNKGWRPNRPTQATPTLFRYSPDKWEPPLRDGSYPSGLGSGGGDIVTGYYRWTRGGLKGKDGNGREINTGQPNP